MRNVYNPSECYDKLYLVYDVESMFPQSITSGSGNIVICDNSDKIGVICISVYVIHMGSNLTILFIFTFIYLYLLLFMGLLEIVEDKWAISK